MVATRRRLLCYYCRNEQPDGGHHHGCPFTGPIGPVLGHKLSKWWEGYNLGSYGGCDADGEYAMDSCEAERSPSRSFALGFRIGWDECEVSVAEAVGDYYFDDENEGVVYKTFYVFRCFH